MAVVLIVEDDEQVRVLANQLSRIGAIQRFPRALLSRPLRFSRRPDGGTVVHRSRPARRFASWPDGGAGGHQAHTGPQCSIRPAKG